MLSIILPLRKSNERGAAAVVVVGGAKRSKMDRLIHAKELAEVSCRCSAYLTAFLGSAET
jgi:hypothetical protein